MHACLAVNSLFSAIFWVHRDEPPGGFEGPPGDLCNFAGKAGFWYEPPGGQVEPARRRTTQVRVSWFMRISVIVGIDIFWVNYFL